MTHMGNETPPRSGPSIVLVGGQMTVDDGSSFDSRQVVAGDEQAELTLRTLASSLLWWKATISVVKPVLESAGTEAYALVLGTRTVMEVRADGSTHRTRLRSLLPGGTSDAEIIRSGIKQPLPEGYEEAVVLQGEGDQYADLGTVGFRRGTSGTRWWFLNGSDWYLSHVGPIIKPAVIVTTMPWGSVSDLFSARQYETFESIRLFSDDLVLVAPHTSSSDTYLRGYSAWNAAGRPPDPEPAWSALPEMPEQALWDPDARPDPIHYATPIPISADFRVTGLYESGDWRDPANLEAARLLLEARYDLKIGIWDLASNPTLRQTLLDVNPVLSPPPVTAAVPVAAAKRAEARVDAKMAAKAAEKMAWAAIAPHLGALTDAGWVENIQRGLYSYQLVLADAAPYDPEQERYRLVHLSFAVVKRQASVSIGIAMYNQVDLPAYTDRHRVVLEAIAAPDLCTLGGTWPMLWTGKGGWDDEVDWSERAQRLATMTPKWRDVFAELCDECRRVRVESGYPAG